MSSDITETEVEQAVRDTAAVNPDTWYVMDGRTDCVYYPTPDNPLGCIIGAAMRTLGHDLDEDMDTLVASSAIVRTGIELRNQDLIRWLDWVQQFQDAGDAWAECIAQADHALEQYANS